MRIARLALALLALTATLRADPARDFRALLDTEWDYTMEHAPTWASTLGDRRWNDRWADASPEAIARDTEHQRGVLKQLDAIGREALPSEERLNFDLFRYQLELGIEESERRLFTLPVSQMGGIQFTDDLADSLRLETVQDFEDWLTRLRTLPRVIEQTAALMRIGIAEKRTHPRVIMESVTGQIAKQLVDKPEESPFFKPFTKLSASVSPTDRERLTAAAKSAIAEQIAPAFRKFADFFEREYLPACASQPGAWQWPEGDATYAFLARKFTTTKLTPDEIHEIGLREVERITAEMERIMAQVGWKGTRAEFFQHLRTEPRFFCKTPEELLEAYRATAKRIDPTLVKLFRTLPRIPYGVEPIPESAAPQSTAAYYRPLAADGSRAGTFFVNLYKPEMRPRHEMMALSLHEAVPGHHFQFAIAFEQAELPKFRRYGGESAFTAYIEGWGLYAESLGTELGLYDDPYSNFGRLTYEIWRACRLVVDTGIHAKRWTRQQAIDFLLSHSAKTELDVKNEIDRYIAWPGQALAYKIGELKIKELRARAAKTLGAKFDVRDFHDLVLRSGAVPLEVLERTVDDWIAAQASK